jgi:general stress protein CsbA/DNA-binding transcriptional ArsR family regulator
MKWLGVMLLALVLISGASAVKEYTAEFNLVDTKAVVDISIVLANVTIDVFEFTLPSDHKALSVYVDGNLVSPLVVDGILYVELIENSELSFNYVTRDFIDKTNFLMNMKLDFDVDDLTIKLVLPEGSSLKKPMKEGKLTSGSIFPKPDRATTDGRSLIFYWKNTGMKTGDEISIFAQIDQKGNPWGWIALIAVIVVAGFFITRSKKEKTREVIIEGGKPYNIEKHLKEDEEQIINILKRKEGSCEQGTLRVVTGFSKATLSRLLTELEDRNVVYKEKRGKKNRVFLKE